MIHLTDPNEMFEQWAKIQETSFKSTMNAMEIFQKRVEKMAGQFWDQTLWASDKIGTAMMDWGNAYKTGYDNLQKTMVPSSMMMPRSEPSNTDANEI